jgi:hypothetical protein
MRVAGFGAFAARPVLVPSRVCATDRQIRPSSRSTSQVEGDLACALVGEAWRNGVDNDQEGKCRGSMSNPSLARFEAAHEFTRPMAAAIQVGALCNGRHRGKSCSKDRGKGCAVKTVTNVPFLRFPRLQTLSTDGFSHSSALFHRTDGGDIMQYRAPM